MSRSTSRGMCISGGPGRSSRRPQQGRCCRRSRPARCRWIYEAWRGSLIDLDTTAICSAIARPGRSSLVAAVFMDTSRGRDQRDQRSDRVALLAYGRHCWPMRLSRRPTSPSPPACWRSRHSLSPQPGSHREGGIAADGGPRISSMNLIGYLGGPRVSWRGRLSRFQRDTGGLVAACSRSLPPIRCAVSPVFEPFVPWSGWPVSSSSISPVFVLGAPSGKLIEVAGFSRLIVASAVHFSGPDRAIGAIVLRLCDSLTYGGVSLFVVVFVYPFAAEMSGKGDIPKRGLIPAPFALGALQRCLLMDDDAWVAADPEHHPDDLLQGPPRGRALAPASLARSSSPRSARLTWNGAAGAHPAAGDIKATARCTRNEPEVGQMAARIRVGGDSAAGRGRDRQQRLHVRDPGRFTTRRRNEVAWHGRADPASEITQVTAGLGGRGALVSILRSSAFRLMRVLEIRPRLDEPPSASRCWLR